MWLKAFLYCFICRREALHYADGRHRDPMFWCSLHTFPLSKGDPWVTAPSRPV